MIVYNVDRAVLRLSNSDDGWKRNLILLNVPVINLEDMNKGREAFNKAINFLTGAQLGYSLYTGRFILV